MRNLYTIFLYFLTPFVLLRLLWRGLRAPAYWQRWGERFGHIQPIEGAPIWVHAVSVGEVQAAVPLLRALLKAYPGVPVLVTTTTPTGSSGTATTTVASVLVPREIVKPPAIGQDSTETVRSPFSARGTR